MAKFGRHQFRSIVLRHVEETGARIFRSVGLTPNSITLIGGSISLAGAFFIAYGYVLLGAIIFLIGSSLDMMDGALARITKSTTKFGGVLDSLVDRLSEASIFTAISIYAIRSDIGVTRLLSLIVLVFLSLTSSQIVSYLRSKGESLGIKTDVGIMTRPERIIVIFIGLVINLRSLEISLVVISTMSIVTAMQRLIHIRRNLKEDQKTSGVIITS